MKEDSEPKVIRRSDYVPYAFVVDSVDLTFVLNQSSTDVTNIMVLRRNMDSASSSLTLDGIDLELLSILLDGDELDQNAYVLDESALIIHQLPDTCTLEIRSRIYPDANTALEGLYRSSEIYCTQCEAQGFRKITWYPDRPDVLSVFRVRVEGDLKRCPVMLSNGNRVSEGLLEGGRHFVEWFDPFPKPGYLFALVAGKLESLDDSFVTQSGRRVDLAIFVEAHNLHKCDYAMQALKASMRWDEQVYGLEYDLDIFMIVAVDDFNMGAMENKGLNVFNSRYVLADQETATDSDFMGVEGVIAHEYFHNWTGNRVTCRDWFQLSLKEGLTVFRDQEFSADMNSRPVKRISDVRLLRSRQFPEDAGPMAHPIRPDEYIEINNFYTVTVYEKGAEVIRMIHTLLGSGKYRKGIDLYFERFDGQAVTCEDFVKAMEDASGVDLGQFRHWYSQAGTPRLKVTDEYDAEAQEYRLQIEQSCPDTPGQQNKVPFQIPFEMGLLDAQNGSELSSPVVLDGEVCSGPIVLDKVLHTLIVPDCHEQPVPSLLRNFSAPVIVDYEYSDQELALLLAHDTDDFNRWDAGQRLYRQIIESISLHSRQSLEHPDYEAFLKAFDQLLSDDTLDSAFLAEALTLPGIETVAEFHAVIEVDKLHQAIETVRRSLAQIFKDKFLKLIKKNREAPDFEVSACAIGRRSLRNTALGFLGSLDSNVWLDTVVSQFLNAMTMTDRVAALRLLCDSEVTEREQLLLDFYTRWQGDRLVIDKWFSVQALSTRDSVVEEVEKLTRHPAFELSNPNRVRSLIGAFAMSNTRGFHQGSGAGYRLLGDYVLMLDQKNPQIAARLAGPFGRFKRFDSVRQSLMKKELLRISNTRGLSPDVYEIVSKALESG